MALVVEDGSGLPNATSYVSRAEYIAFAAARGVTIADADPTDVQLVKAMDKMETLCMKGNPTNDDQALPFPRHSENYDGTLAYPDDSVPVGVKKAQMLLAMAVNDGFDLSPNVSGGVGIKREKIGPLETEYDTASAGDSPTFPLAMSALSTFTCGQGGRVSVLRV